MTTDSTLSIEATWEHQLEAAAPALRARARSLLEICSVRQEPAEEDGGQPVLACLDDSFGTERSRHTFQVASATSADGYSDLDIEVTGSFLEPGADERLVVLSGGSSGSSGGQSGFLFRHRGDTWSLERTLTSFSATSCTALPRPGRTALLLCGFQNTWQGSVSVWASLFDVAVPLTADELNVPEPDPRRGILPPMQDVLARTSSDAYEALHHCPESTFGSTMQPLSLLAPSPVRVSAAPGGASLSLRLHDVTLRTARATQCKEDPTEPHWRTHDVTYALGFAGERLVVTGARRKQDAELRRLLLVPPK